MSSRAVIAISSLVPFLAAACGCPSEPGPLVDTESWTLVDAADDPFPDRIAQIECEAMGYGAEDFGGQRAFSVMTDQCNYLTVVQPAQREVCQGDPLVLRLWHFALFGPEGEGHVALAIDGQMVWEERVAIPSDSGLLVPKFDAPAPISIGTPIHFHLHNHGANSYSLLEVSLAEDE